jgi:hypothetical protein
MKMHLTTNREANLPNDDEEQKGIWNALDVECPLEDQMSRNERKKHHPDDDDDDDDDDDIKANSQTRA